MAWSEQTWSVPVKADQIPEGGRQFVLGADAATREALAQAAGVQEIARLEATFDLTRHGRAGVRVAGTVWASVRQACVVTLDPVDTDIEEAVDLVFVPAPQAVAAAGAAPFHQTPVDAADPPEPLVDGTVDLGAIAAEFMVLGIDPYPRKPGAVFAAPAADDAAAHPFAALAALNSRKQESS
jgi:hypothetical protein